MPRTKKKPQKTPRRKNPQDLNGRIALEPALFTLELYREQDRPSFEVSIRASSDSVRQQGMSRLYHQGGFQKPEAAAKALSDKLESATGISGSRWTSAHQRALTLKLSHVGVKGVTIPLRDILRAVQ